MASRKTGLILGVALAGVAAAAMAGSGTLGLTDQMASARLRSGFSSPTVLDTPAMFAPPLGAPLSFADIFQKVSPAVVSINVTERVNVSRGIHVPGLPFNVVPNTCCQGGDGGDDGDDGASGGGTDHNRHHQGRGLRLRLLHLSRDG